MYKRQEVAVNGNEVTVKGPKGTMTQTFNSDLTVTVENGEVLVTRPSDDKEHRSLHGLTRTLIANMVHGVSEGFTKEPVSYTHLVFVFVQIKRENSDLTWPSR